VAGARTADIRSGGALLPHPRTVVIDNNTTAAISPFPIIDLDTLHLALCWKEVKPPPLTLFKEPG
jgi:hypothetical protein